MRYYELLEDTPKPINEMVGKERLFHWTTPDAFESIMESDCLMAYSSQFNPEPRVYFTRTPHATMMNNRGILLVLDGGKLRQRYKIELRYGDSAAAAEVAASDPNEYAPIIPRRESEEFIARPVQPLSRYLTRIVIQEYYMNMLRRAVSDDRGFGSLHDLKPRAIAVENYTKKHNIPIFVTKDLILISLNF